jgi:hypothetical protein
VGEEIDGGANPKPIKVGHGLEEVDFAEEGGGKDGGEEVHEFEDEFVCLHELNFKK